MARDEKIVRTADICDGHRTDARVCELQFCDYGARKHFHGIVETISTYESNLEIMEVLSQGGGGKVLVVDGRGSIRTALCGGNIANEAYHFGWEGLVFNGAIRDSHEFANLDFGVKALGTTAMPPANRTQGNINITVNFGNITFHPGDYLYADQDSIILLNNSDHG